MRSSFFLALCGKTIRSYRATSRYKNFVTSIHDFVWQPRASHLPNFLTSHPLNFLRSHFQIAPRVRDSSEKPTVSPKGERGLVADSPTEPPKGEGTP